MDSVPISSTVTGDNIQRPADGVYGTYPMKANQALTNRPIILNRPFRNVGELGYAYRGIEWKTIDFSSAVSGDAGLLDMFSIGESQKLTQVSSGVYSSVPLTAGIVNINTRNPEVLQALLSGSLEYDLDTSASSVISQSQTQNIAQAIVTETTGNKPLINRSELVTRVMSLSGVTSALSGVTQKPQREAVVRALAEPADTRTWNLLIDLDVQAGRYPTGATALGQFDVQGERRYWLHVAIDRYTGKVIDEQVEVVYDN